MAERALQLFGPIPNEGLPSPGSAEREALAEEYERGRREALAELRAVGQVPQHVAAPGLWTASCWQTNGIFPHVVTAVPSSQLPPFPAHTIAAAPVNLSVGGQGHVSVAVVTHPHVSVPGSVLFNTGEEGEP